MKINRFLFTIIILAFIIYGPWWMSLILGIIGIIVFVPYVEILVLSAILDALVMPYRHDFFIGACILICITYFLRKKIAIYDRYA